MAKLPSRAGVFPEYSRWFLPCGRRWLHEYQKKAVSFVENAWEDDKQQLQVRRWHGVVNSVLLLVGVKWTQSDLLSAVILATFGILSIRDVYYVLIHVLIVWLSM